MLLKIFLIAVGVVLMLSAISYYNVYTSVREEKLAELKTFVSERVRTDSEIFRLAMDNLNVFSEEFMKLYASHIEVKEEEFWSYYFVDAEGATRMDRKYFDGIYTDNGDYIYGLSSFIGNNQEIEDPEFKRRLILASKVLAKLGPAWVNRFANVHVAYPENAITLFYPDEPWGLNVRADLPMNELGVIRAVSKNENPQRHGIWSGLYYDETAEKWMITYMDPLDEGDRHLITPAHDIYLTDLMERLIETNKDGAYNFIIRKDGYLVAHPTSPTDEQKWVGQLSLDKIDMPSVKEAYRLIEKEIGEGFSEVKVIENKGYDSYLAVGQLDGPEWIFVRVFPMSIIREAAHNTAGKVLIEGLTMLFIILMIVYFVMRQGAEKPLEKLRAAAEAIGRGEHEAVSEGDIKLPIHLKNEIGILSTTFVEMAGYIKNSKDNLERIVQERTAALQDANRALKEMSLLDGLTGIHNRRAFDRSMAKVFADAQEEKGIFSVMIADIDCFKSYNDTYGHVAGDEAIKQIATTLKNNIREEDRVFRYGGEEFVVIFNQANAPVALEAATRLINTIKDLNIPHKESPYGCITISGGLSQYNKTFISGEEMLKEADQKLYRAKEEGRNRLCI